MRSLDFLSEAMSLENLNFVFLFRTFGILTPIILIVGHSYTMHLSEAIYNFPYPLVSTLFCIATFLIYPLCLFKNRKVEK